jgi:hypothetical protein
MVRLTERDSTGPVAAVQKSEQKRLARAGGFNTVSNAMQRQGSPGDYFRPPTSWPLFAKGFFWDGSPAQVRPANAELRCSLELSLDGTL